ncbi:hypothetical protein FO440_11070 [Mucilaginibacter corticis]|uniref:Uncharacterized protein n=1 Tax=Mucilaginibacter corticis TaxID=2597670 RepID=A0A556MK97_9SPHI|nr:hypothetical protein [Mucilaginibacter corticis]TSJ40293.1 hypothetical protein FO440_11070 [Mucilaginibacter corticis]
MFDQQPNQSPKLFQNLEDILIAVIDLEYIYLNLAVRFTNKYNVNSFGTKQSRINELKATVLQISHYQSAKFDCYYNVF